MPIPSQISPSLPLENLKIQVFGYESAQRAAVAQFYGGAIGETGSAECDLAIFVIDPAQGIDPGTIADWESLDESMVPRLIAVLGLDNPQADFDDAVMLANRVFAQTLTPFLVLHGDDGVACALIRLADMKILNYKTFPPTIEESEEEHHTLVAEFRIEFLEALEVMGPDAFSAGMLFPAVPLWIENKIGVDIISNYVDQLIDARI